MSTTQVVIHPEQKKTTSKSLQELDTFYEIDKTIQYVKKYNFSKIALQFPDELLNDSVQVSQRLQSLSSSKFYILGDTSYGSCCVDEIASQHVDADMIVHYGNACLQRVKRLPVLHVFGRAPIDLKICVQEFKKNYSTEDKVVVLYELMYAYVIPQLKQELADYKKILFADVNQQRVIQNMPNSTVQQSKLKVKNSFELNGLYFTLPENEKIENYSIFYIGEENVALTQIMLEFSVCKFSRFSGVTNQFDDCTQSSSNARKMLQRRYFLIEKAKNAEVFGIIVATLSIENYLEMLNYMKKLISSRGKRYYVVIVGKLNVTKLANFTEVVDMFALISCGQNSLIDSKEFTRPVITPYELELALKKGKTWTGEFITDYNKLLSEIDSSIPDKNIDQDDEEEVRFSLIDGKIKHEVYKEKEDSSSGNSLIELSKGTDVVLSQSTGLSVLSKREWQGLETRIGETPVEKAVEGLSGIAKGYIQEKCYKKD